MCRNKKQRYHSAQQVHRVCASENIKKAARLIARDVHSLRHELTPGHELSRYKQKT